VALGVLLKNFGAILRIETMSRIANAAVCQPEAAQPIEDRLLGVGFIEVKGLWIELGANRLISSRVTLISPPRYRVLRSKSSNHTIISTPPATQSNLFVNK
jgi:hypothetical protein